MSRGIDRLVVACLVGALGAAAGCKSGDCRKGCEHLLDVARKDIEAQKIPDDARRSLLEQADKGRAQDLDRCVQRCSMGRVDARCMQGIARIEDFDRCVRK